jgi:hypothetical protein
VTRSIWVRAGLVVLLAVVSASSIFVFHIWRRGHYVTGTFTCMRRLMNALGSEPLAPANPETLEAATKSFGLDHCSEDAWGHSFEIEAAPGADPPFRLRSLGRDGQRGPCCKVVTNDWDDDAVLEGEKWLQGWK